MNQQTKERNNVQKLDNVGSNPLLPAFSKGSGDDSANLSSSRIRRQRPGETKTVNRKVSFCNYAVCVEVPSLLDVSDEEHSALWFSRDDFRSFRRSMKSKTVLVQQRYSKFQSDIEEVQDGILEYCQQEDDEEKQKQLPSFQESSLKVRIGLRNWCRQHDFRGLEKWVSKELLEHREVARDGVSFVVALSKIVDDPVQLSERYQKLTRSHKAFARLLGEGDALTNDNHEEHQQHHGILIPGGPHSSPTLAYHRKLNIDSTPRPRFSRVPSIATRINRQPR